MLDLVRKHLDLLEAALDAMSGNILVLDQSGHIVLVNTAWRSRFPMARRREPEFGPAATLRSLGILDARDEDTARFLAELDHVASGGAVAPTRIGRSAGPGNARWYRMHAARLRLGRWTGVVVTLLDVSDAQLARQALNRLSLRLNRLQEQERERIALELHDSTAQHLAATSLSLAALKARLSLTGPIRSLLDDAERSLQSALHEVQVTSFGLYTPHLDEGGLNATLDRFVRTYARQTGIVTTLFAPALDLLPEKLQETLLRVAQEALTNVHRHAAASRAHVRLRLTRESVVLCVADDGRGMNRANRADMMTAGTGIGIAGMHARLDRLGGTLRVKSCGGHGTRILARLPLPDPHQRAKLGAMFPSWLQATGRRRKRRDSRVVAKAS